MLLRPFTSGLSILTLEELPDGDLAALTANFAALSRPAFNREPLTTDRAGVIQRRTTPPPCSLGGGFYAQTGVGTLPESLSIFDPFILNSGLKLRSPSRLMVGATWAATSPSIALTLVQADLSLVGAEWPGID